MKTQIEAGSRVVLGGVYGGKGQPIRKGTAEYVKGSWVGVKLDGESRVDEWPADAVIALPA